jgi:N-acetyl-gamma-glutamyl-phosphate reductase
MPEIVQALYVLSKSSTDLTFVPHVAGIEAGIYSTIYVTLKKGITQSGLRKLYGRYYRGKPFVRINEGMPKLKEVVGTNFCNLGVYVEKKQAIITSCLDNLIKGAAGNAIQCMNVMLGFAQKTGLL